ncbi:MAG: M48 family metalloprotease [bacterium]|nr:M48 family metalloprotease [bacterium]
MKLNRFLLGAAAGASAGYAAWRWYETARTLRTPRPPLPPNPVRYGRTRRALALAALLRETSATLAFAYGPFAPRLQRALAPLPAWLRPALLAAVATLGTSLLDGGIAFAEGYDLERRFAQSEQSARAWASDYVKASLLGTGVAAVLGALGGAAVRRFPRAWPYAAAAGLLPLYALAQIVVPLYVLPLFNRFEPLRGPLEGKIRTLAARYGVGDAEILRMDMSRQTNKANAFVAGIGTTHRIVLGDTLLEHFPDDEILFVVAHELGHYVERDTWRMIGAAELASIAALAAASARADRDLGAEHALARISARIGVAFALLRPALAAYSRSREWTADRFALAATDDPGAGVRAFERLRERNLAEDDVPRWYELIFASHPSLGRRIRALRQDERTRPGRQTNATA